MRKNKRNRDMITLNQSTDGSSFTQNWNMHSTLTITNLCNEFIYYENHTTATTTTTSINLTKMNLKHYWNDF